MPPLLLQAFGMTDAAQLATPAGFLDFGFFSYMMLVLAAYAVIAGLSVTANEEDRGIMDVLLSLPIPRWRLVVERFLAYALILVLILVLTFLAAVVWRGKPRPASIWTWRGCWKASINMLPSDAAGAGVHGAGRERCCAVARAAAAVGGGLRRRQLLHRLHRQGRQRNSGGQPARDLVLQLVQRRADHVHRVGMGHRRAAAGRAVVVMAAGSLWFFERRDIGV